MERIDNEGWHYNNPDIDPNDPTHREYPEGAIRRRNNPATNLNEEQIYKHGKWNGFESAF